MNFLRNNRVDVLVLDYLLGDEEIDGLPMIKQLMSNFPWLKILLSSTLENTAIVRMALKIGVRGMLVKAVIYRSGECGASGRGGAYLSVRKYGERVLPDFRALCRPEIGFRG
jgi:PleD family two-component response regulator